MSPAVLSKYLGQKFPPTEQQAEIIGAEPGPLLVVAGAGAGKTETMAARVVWLVANGYARPEEVLGLTFTRKAAQELGKRIRDRLSALASNADLVRRLDPSGQLARSLEIIAPTVSTYDAYAGDLVREYGLLVPVEPDARMITDAELHAIAHEVVQDYAGTLLVPGGANPTPASVVTDLLDLVTNMGNDLAEPDEVAEHARTFLAETEALDGGKDPAKFTNEMTRWRATQERRRAYLPLVEKLASELAARGVVTFNEQMSVAARLASHHPAVGASQRSRFRVVMLDEYQDTSHAQRVLLRSLFGEGSGSSEDGRNPLTVTAVGDPMQAIYGWRGATVENLAAFVEDFPAPDGGPAPKMQLTTSWRNPPEVLALANEVSDALLGTGAKRPVAPLEPRPGAAPGEVLLGYFERDDEELDFLADELARQYNQAQEDGEPFSAAVLVRANKTSPEVAEALAARGIPYEIVGLAGLLDVPEVADTVAIATMLVRPDDSAAALRVLAGPAVGLGLDDLDALAARAANLRGARPEAEMLEDPLEHYRAQLRQLVEEAADITAGGDAPAGLTDAVADHGEEERYSQEGLARINALSSKLRRLRTQSLGKRLPDLFADIISVFGIRTEVLSRPSATGAAHLDRLLDVVATYPGTSLDSLLDYFQLAREHEGGLTPGNVVVASDRVQILTAHKAKGLEWDTVAVARADASTYKAQASTFLTQIGRVPDEDFDAFDDAEDRKQFAKAAKNYIAADREKMAEEAARLFYVAVTRTERKLIITASRTVPGRQSAAEPYEHFAAIRGLVPDHAVVAWAGGEGRGEGREESSAEETAPAEPVSFDREREGTWPHLRVDPADAAAADLVSAAIEDLPALTEGELYSLWERDTTALIEEHLAAQAPEVPVMLPGELTASDMVALKADPEQFARRARRPVPFKPNAYAKRGTAFHAWLEEFYHARPLLTEDELPGGEEPDVDKRTLELLKSNFEKSHWAAKTPAYVEQPFELALGSAVVRGRMDAVFEQGGSWVVVDWKTGTKPAPAQMESAKLQLAVYAEAWRRIAADGRPVRAMFFYVRTGEDFEPGELPGSAELERLLRQSAGHGLEFQADSGAERA
ncbi:ATP-dependent helicase [Corynebacterium liangguodongii]|uniref:DNA 3'-5' helicase n=1 Tax=Corynebacterium liangguodongii TaxID=2079535 RepID=A0A2S0WCR9_9CORY|nr:UvrD-helicase domain-containing protein [Corynebacterium liangguodongii]AWB83563.1 DNA helicase II [Corynebacterium liangguodongii]PWC00348.1 ATP-dependent helicase [Corynebacterium liangguodongii]